MPHHPKSVDLWSVEGQFQHLIYSPKGSIEGVLIDTGGIPTQFVMDPRSHTILELFGKLRTGQMIVIEGSEAEPSGKGESPHSIYDFKCLVSVDGKALKAPPSQGHSAGTVVRFNYAKHGAANGVVLDNGDFIHTRPDGLARLGLKVGDKVDAVGEQRELVTATGRVIEAQRVNGKPVGP